MSSRLDSLLLFVQQFFAMCPCFWHVKHFSSTRRIITASGLSSVCLIRDSPAFSFDTASWNSYWVALIVSAVTARIAGSPHNNARFCLVLDLACPTHCISLTNSGIIFEYSTIDFPFSPELFCNAENIASTAASDTAWNIIFNFCHTSAGHLILREAALHFSLIAIIIYYSVNWHFSTFFSLISFDLPSGSSGWDSVSCSTQIFEVLVLRLSTYSHRPLPLKITSMSCDHAK